MLEKNNYIIKKILQSLILLYISIILIPSVKSFPVDFQIAGTLSEQYDDNIYNSDQKEWDLITQAMLSIGVVQEGRSSNWSLTGQTTQQIYAANNQLNNNAQTIELGYSKEISNNDRFSITDNFGHYPEPQEVDFMFGLMSGRSGYYTNAFTASYTINLLRFFNISLQYDNTYIKNQSIESADTLSNSGRINSGYEINSFNIISIFYSYNYNKTLNANDADSILQNAGMGYNLFFTRQLSLNSQAGLNYAKSEQGKNYNYLFSMTLADQIDENNNLSLTASKGYSLNPLINAIFNVWNINFNYTKQLSSIISVNFNGSYQYGTSVSDATDMRIRIIGIRAGLNYSISELVSTGISYNYTYNNTRQLEPVLEHIKFNRNQIQISLTGMI